MAEALCDQLFSDADGELTHHHSDADDLFGILEAWEDCVTGGSSTSSTPRGAEVLQATTGAATERGELSPTVGKKVRQLGEPEDSTVPAAKRQKKCSPAVSSSEAAAAATSEDGAANSKTSHITVERNRRKQMNGHLAVLRSLMPCFYVKRGDQASIIGGVVDYIKELQQVLQSLEAKKQRKAYTEQVLSPRPPPACCSPRPPLPLKSTPPISPRPTVPISPRTPPPTPGSPYKLISRPPPPPPPLPLPLSPQGSVYASPARTPTREASSASAAAAYLPSLDTIAAELCAYAAGGTTSKQRPAELPAAAVGSGGVPLPDVKVEFAGANLVVRTVSHRAPGQAVKVIAALEGRALEILDAKITTVDDTAVNSFTIKIGIECELSAEELVQEIQQAFS